MYSFIFDQTYINLFVLIVIVFLVMFLWRKVIILEGNFFILEKRVNLIKKDSREDSISKSLEKSDIIMNEIFKDSSRSNACPNFEYLPSKGGDDADCDTESPTAATAATAATCDTIGECPIFKKNSTDNISINEDMVKYISSLPEDNLSDNTEKATNIEIVSFTNVSSDKDSGLDTDKILDTIISSGEDIEITELGEHNEPDNMSVSSEITFTNDDKKNDKRRKKIAQKSA